MLKRTEERRPLQLMAVLGLAGALGSGCSAPDEADEPVEATRSSALTISQRQANMNAFYDMSNVPLIQITMADDTEWAKLQADVPRGPDGQPVGCGSGSDTPAGFERYPAHTGATVIVSGTTFSNVEIKKKSYCGSFDTVKPSLKIKLPTTAEDSVLGTRYLVLNNSKQDPSFVRQCLAYKLFGMAGLPHSRCNFAKVNVKALNGAVLSTGVWVNVEPIRERFIDNPDNHFTNAAITNGKAPGNLYELENDDFTSTRMPYIDVENLSKFTDKKDLVVANAEIAGGLDRMLKVVDIDNFIKLYAMEVLLKHGDGYSTMHNNTYVYNDVAAVANPTANSAQVNFKFIPSGPDEILKYDYFKMSDNSLVGNLVHHDAGLAVKLAQQIQSYRSGILSRATIAGELKTFIDQMESKLATQSMFLTTEIAVVRKQLTLARSAGYYFGGFTNTTGAYVLSDDGESMHASNTETFPSSTEFEVVHHPQAEVAADRWWFDPSPIFGYRVRSEAYGRYLHASATIRTPANHLSVYQTTNIISNSPDYWPFFETDGTSSGITGYFTLRSQRTNLFLRFGDANDPDPTPGTGRQRVYQAPYGSGTRLFWN